MPGGRPTKLDTGLLAALNQSAEEYWSINHACAAQGITDTTWRNWRTQGAEDIDAGKPDTLHAQFFLLAARVGSPKRLKDMGGVLKEIALDPKARPEHRIAAAQTLIRLDAPAKVEHSGPEEGPIDVALKGFKDSISRMIENKGRV